MILGVYSVYDKKLCCFQGALLFSSDILVRRHYEQYATRVFDFTNSPFDFDVCCIGSFDTDKGHFKNSDHRVVFSMGEVLHRPDEKNEKNDNK